MWDVFQKGGFIMYPILLSSIIALAVIIERRILLWRTRVASGDEIRKICDAARRGDRDGVEQGLSGSETPVHGVLRTIWNAGGSEDARERAAGVYGDDVLHRLNRRLPWLAILGSLVPLMGLLGTVLGMIRVFSNVAEAGDVSDITLLAGGIWEALITTAAGLTVAIPILLAYHWLLGKVDRAAFDMRKAGEDFIAAMHVGMDG